MENASDARKNTVDLTASIQQVNQIIDRLRKASGFDGEQRKTLLEASRRLRASVETPVEYIFRFVFQVGARIARTFKSPLNHPISLTKMPLYE
jgi:hypothetical protein